MLTNLLYSLDLLLLLILRMLLPFGELNFALDMRTEASLGILGLFLRNLTIPCKHNRHGEWGEHERHVPSGAYSPHHTRPGESEFVRYTLHSLGSPSLVVARVFAIFTNLVRLR